MPEQPDRDGVEVQPDSDLEYDLAHEWAADPHGARWHHDVPRR